MPDNKLPTPKKFADSVINIFGLNDRDVEAYAECHAALVEVLEKWAEHPSKCAWHWTNREHRKCTCGLDEMRARVK